MGLGQENFFLQNKWERVFYTFFDINKNQSIEWNDFELLFQKIKEIRGEESTEYKIASDTMGAVWRGLLLETKHVDICLEDVPEDTLITIEEWDKLWRCYNPARMLSWQKEYLKYMFFLLDKTGDKFIDKQEFVDVMQLYHMSKNDAERAFGSFAIANGKKTDKVDYGLFVKLWNEYWCSNDRKSPGNFLFGPW